MGSYHNPSFIVSPDYSPVPIGMAFTKSAWELARHQRVAEVTAQPDPLQALTAAAMGINLQAVRLLPTMFVVRNSRPERELFTTWDARLPRDASESDPGFFVAASHLTEEAPYEMTREYLANAAKQLGAAALVEVSLPGWLPSDLPKHAGAVMSGMIAGQRPLELPSPSSIVRGFREAMAPFTAIGRAANRVPGLQAASATYPQPFTVSYH